MPPSLNLCGGEISSFNREGSSGSDNNNNNNSSGYIEHEVSKMDTLAGIAIKYGVEVADVKRLNGLVTDNQIYAMKILLIPSPGRHPPSPVVSLSASPPHPPPRPNGIHKTPPRPRRTGVLESIESLRLNSDQEGISPAMSTLQKYYGLESSNHVATEETEMGVHRTGSLDNLNEHRLPKASPLSAPTCRNKKSRSFFSSFFNGNDAVMEVGSEDGEKSNEKSIRRRQKADADSRVGLNEWLLKDENDGETSDFSAVTDSSSAMRQKSAYRNPLVPDSVSVRLNSISVGLSSVIADGLSGFRKSSSTSSLQEDTGNYSLWQTSKWSLKPDLQALSTAAINIPLFDGRRGKAALD